ncbi:MULTISPECIES: aromatic amino acid lyase [unclassified Dietzia]|uniref:aromatic amino acid lyase n=1 Tax=unclassified Dietzia TaxID=2617939 RepID=UPI0015FA81E9|nr:MULTISPECIES: aromatic amino acid lyase [unclassified Dietzia]MBB1039964.1 aromatic amino acid lyase [Dietzia sp. Cai40]MBB1043149.1 aromatic amino acid lyase [Dietzia sp. DQ11-44]
MPESRVVLVNNAVDSGSIDRSWTEAEPQIIAERGTIDQGIDEGSLGKIYGFTTLLGQLDAVESTAQSQGLLLRSHLIGRRCSMSAEWLRTISAVKIHQLAQGGSGISGQTFRALLDSFGHEVVAEGAWWDSYGCGDVVPAAWWVNATLGESAVSGWAAGDLIALINGNFLSTASVVMAGRRLRRTVEGSSELVDRILRGPDEKVGARHLQLPVSRRPPHSVDAIGRAAIANLDDAAGSALKCFSGNPVFSFSDEVGVHSVSSFLNIEAAAAISAVLRRVRLMGALAVRAIEVECQRRIGAAGTVDQLRFVQPPKVAAAILAEGALPGTDTAGGLISGSEGLEDVADAALSSSRYLHLALDNLATIMRILEAVVEDRSLILDGESWQGFCWGQ